MGPENPDRRAPVRAAAGCAQYSGTASRNSEPGWAKDEYWISGISQRYPRQQTGQSSTPVGPHEDWKRLGRVHWLRQRRFDRRRASKWVLPAWHSSSHLLISWGWSTMFLGSYSTATACRTQKTADFKVGPTLQKQILGEFNVDVYW